MIRVFDRNKMVHSFEAHEESVMSLCFTDNPYELFSCGQDGAVKIWDMRKQTEVMSLKVLYSLFRHTKVSMMRLGTVSVGEVVLLLQEEPMELSKCLAAEPYDNSVYYLRDS